MLICLWKYPSCHKIQALLRQGQLEAAYHIFAYLEHHETARFVFDPKMTNVNEETFNIDADWWRDFYNANTLH